MGSTASIIWHCIDLQTILLFKLNTPAMGKVFVDFVFELPLSSLSKLLLQIIPVKE